jgi:PAS domain S-box-containing protein
MGRLFTGRSDDVEHERLAAVILDGMYQFVALLTPKGDILEVNRAALEGAGHRIEEIRGKPFWTARWWQVSEEIQEQLKAAIRRAASGEFVRYEVQVYGEKSGLNPITVDFSLQPIRGESGEVEYLLPEGRNITERKQAENEADRQSEERFRAFVAASSDVVYRMSPDWTILRHLVGRRFIADTQSPDQSWLEHYIHPEDQQVVMAAIQQAIQTKSTFELEHRVFRVDGTLGWTLSRATPMMDDQGNIVEWLGTASDVTARKQAQEKLRKSLEKLNEQALLLDLSNDAVLVRDKEDRVTYWNRGATEIYGYTREEAAGRVTHELLRTEFPEPLERIHEKLSRDGRWSGELIHTRKDGGRIIVGSCWALERDGKGKAARILETNNEITQRKQAEDALRRLAAIVESSEDAIVSKDLNGIVRSWNPQAERMFGYTVEEMIGQPITIIIPPELYSDEEMILGKIKNGQKIDHFETVRVAKSGERIDVSLSISPVKDERGRIVGAAKIARDIREHRRIERALRTTEKLAAAGRLAATVAHEINNPLEAVTNLIYLAKRDLPDADRVAIHLNMATQELERVAHIARQTLGFYRDTTAPIRMNLDKTLNDLLLLYEKRLEVRNIRLVKQCVPDAEVKAFAGEIRQAISNLLTNSMDAMPAGGTLTVRIRRTHKWNNSDVPGVRITIADTGTGITPEHRRNLFQPFFTTKADVGTGLGLWITRGIVDKHGGLMQLKSGTGGNRHGTAFSIFLPFDREQAVQSPSTQDASGRKVSTEVFTQ